MGIATHGLLPPDTAGIPSCSDALDLKNGGETLQDKSQAHYETSEPAVFFDSIGSVGCGWVKITNFRSSFILNLRAPSFKKCPHCVPNHREGQETDRLAQVSHGKRQSPGQVQAVSGQVCNPNHNNPTQQQSRDIELHWTLTWGTQHRSIDRTETTTETLFLTCSRS